MDPGVFLIRTILHDGIKKTAGFLCPAVKETSVPVI
jgi:hypothetical protein